MAVERCAALACLVVCLLLAGPSQLTAAGGCASGWFVYAGHCYSLTTPGVSWASARSACQNNGAYLVNIGSAAENSYLAKLLVPFASKNYAYIGFNDISVEGRFVWVNSGQTGTYTHWNAGEPNNANSGEDCAVLYGTPYEYWNDQECSLSSSFLCERDLNECSAGTHTCSVNAVCTNTDGSYTCACKATYSGNGRTCVAIAVGRCATGWSLYTGHCYSLTAKEASWASAKSACQNQGAYLANIGSAAENSFLAKTLVPRTKNNQAYIGFNDISSEGNFVWDDTGKPGTYTNWRSGEPNNGGGNEDCTLILATPAESWNDIPCSVPASYLCERDLNECSAGTHTCSVNAVCTNTDGSYTCACKATYSGDGRMCFAIAAGRCATGWSFYAGHCYSLTVPAVSWTAAKLACQSQSAYLVNIGSAAENSFLTIMLVPRANNKQAYIGFNDISSEGKFVWDDTGKPGTYTNWRSGEPNNSGGNEDCTVIWATPDKNWNDLPCYTPASYLCERDLNECSARTRACSINAVCTNTDGSYTCACKAGFSGSGRQCIDLNECNAGIHGCSVNAVCINTNGGYTCTCKAGFSGNGRQCIDLNECSAGTHTCSVNAVCTNTKGSYTCACKAGFSGDGQCLDVDECLSGSHDCDVDALCTNSVGSYKCACKRMYEGDGKNCTALPDLCSELVLVNNVIMSGDKTAAYQSTRSFSCPPDYVLKGSRTRTCQLDGTWSGTSATCVYNLTCPYLGAPTNGYVVGSGYSYGSVLQFACAAGYTLAGSVIRVCQSNLLWSGQAARCDVTKSASKSSGSSNTGLILGLAIPFGLVVIITVAILVDRLMRRHLLKPQAWSKFTNNDSCASIEVVTPACQNQDV